MDNGSDKVVAADGIVISKVDGNYDRCYFTVVGATVSCDGYPIEPNYVDILHANGYITRYFHLKKGSIVVEVGDVVKCGDLLEVLDPEGNSVDPYTADKPSNNSMWIKQNSYYNIPTNVCN